MTGRKGPLPKIYISIHEHQTRPNPALAAVQGQAVLLLPYDVPTYYVSRELLAASLRTELPDDLVFAAIPFPFDGSTDPFPQWLSNHAASHTSTEILHFVVLIPHRYGGTRIASSTLIVEPSSNCRVKLGAILLNCFDLTSRRDSRALRSNPNSKRGNERSTTFVFANG